MEDDGEIVEASDESEDAVALVNYTDGGGGDLSNQPTNSNG